MRVRKQDTAVSKPVNIGRARLLILSQTPDPIVQIIDGNHQYIRRFTATYDWKTKKKKYQAPRLTEDQEQNRFHQELTKTRLRVKGRQTQTEKLKQILLAIA